MPVVSIDILSVTLALVSPTARIDGAVLTSIAVSSRHDRLWLIAYSIGAVTTSIFVGGSEASQRASKPERPARAATDCAASQPVPSAAIAPTIRSVKTRINRRQSRAASGAAGPATRTLPQR